MSEPVDSGKCFYLLLSRAIVNNNQVNQDESKTGEKSKQKGRKSRQQSAKKPPEEDRRRSKVEEAAKKVYEENLKPDSDDEHEECKWEYNSKEGMYLHYTYETIYPEYILVIEPLPRNTKDPNEMTALKSAIEDIKKEIKSHINNFWKTVKQNVQKSLHPKMIESKESLIKNLKLKISVSKKELEQNKWYTKDLQSILAKKDIPK